MACDFEVPSNGAHEELWNSFAWLEARAQEAIPGEQRGRWRPEPPTPGQSIGGGLAKMAQSLGRRSSAVRDAEPVELHAGFMSYQLIFRSRRGRRVNGRVGEKLQAYLVFNLICTIQVKMGCQEGKKLQILGPQSSILEWSKLSKIRCM